MTFLIPTITETKIIIASRTLIKYIYTWCKALVYSNLINKNRLYGSNLHEK
jgi:hypothetical protein